MKYIHFKCLLHWLKTKIQIDKSEYIENNFFSVYSPENIQCELCKEYLPHFIKHKNKLFNLTELEQNFDTDVKVKDNNDNKEKNIENKEFWDENYVALDTMSPDKEITPYRYIVKFSKNKILKIGRGLDANLILNDLSISRNHCQLELNDNGDIFLKDNNSKFGTLVLVQTKSIEILKGQVLTIQVGRTFFNINYKNNFSLFNCCKAEDIDLKNTYEKINNKSIKLEKNNEILTESESEGEGGEEDQENKIKDEDKKYENEYDNNIKKLNNKKIKIMKISKMDKKENTDTNNKNSNEEKNDTNKGISNTEQMKENNKSKNNLINLNKNDNDEENEKNKKNKQKEDNNKDELINKEQKNDN